MNNNRLELNKELKKYRSGEVIKNNYTIVSLIYQFDWGKNKINLIQLVKNLWVWKNLDLQNTP